MNPPQQFFEIHIQQALDACWQGWFDGLEMVTLEENAGSGGTLLRGELPDQAALFGVLARIRDLNLTLLEVRALRR